MAQLIINLEDDVKVRLQRLAVRNGNTMGEEIRRILQSAVRCETVRSSNLGTRIAARFKQFGLTSDLRELRGEPRVLPILESSDR
jgi:plasmid stability protein